MKVMLSTTLLFLGLLNANYVNADYDKEITQFHDSMEEGIRIKNNSLFSTVIYARFLIPGLNEKELRNSGTKQILYPRQEVVFFLPKGTKVVATDGVYWDNPKPNFPEEKLLVTIEEKNIIELSAKAFSFK